MTLQYNLNMRQIIESMCENMAHAARQTPQQNMLHASNHAYTYNQYDAKFNKNTLCPIKK